MIKKTETIQVRLTNYGTIEVVSIPTRIYKDSYNVMKLSCIVPKTQDENLKRICKVYATGTDESGNVILTSHAYNMPRKEEIDINGFDYIVYERDLPQEFCVEAGDITLTFAEGVVDGEVDTDGNIVNGEFVKLNVSGQLNLFVNGDGYNYNGVKISDHDATASKVNEIAEEVERLKIGVTPEILDNVIEDSESIVKMLEDDKLKFELEEGLTSKISKALVVPMDTLTSTEIVAVDDGNSQTMLGIGEGLDIKDGKLYSTVQSSEGVFVIDSLTSQSTTDALSARQGNVLYNMIVDGGLDARKQLVLGAEGVLNGNVYSFTVDNAEDYVDYRTNLTKFLVDLNLPVAGAIDETKEVAITFGDITYYVFNILKGMEHATIGDLHQVDKYNNETGYRFIAEMTFFENNDVVGFAIIPTISMSDVLALDSDQMDNYMADGGLTQGQLAVCKKVITNGYEEGAIYKFVIEYPNTYSWEQLTYAKKEIKETIDFAESERQKSKNLFDKDAFLYQQDINLGETGQAIVNGASAIRIAQNSLKLIAVKPNTRYIFSNPSNFKFSLGQVTIDKKSLGDTGWLTNTPTYSFVTTSNTYYLGIIFGKDDNSTISQSDYSVFMQQDYQLEEGTVATDYQPYNGVIVHENDIADVERCDVVYDITTKQTPLGGTLAYTKGLYGTVGMDLSKYRFIRVYYQHNYGQYNMIINCDVGKNGSGLLLSEDTNILATLVSCTTTSFTLKKSGYYVVPAMTFTDRTSDAEISDGRYCVYRIEGVY